MNIEELQALNPEAKIKEAIELNPESVYLIVLEEDLPHEYLCMVKKIFSDTGIKAIISCKPTKVYRLEQS